MYEIRCYDFKKQSMTVELKTENIKDAVDEYLSFKHDILENKEDITYDGVALFYIFTEKNFEKEIRLEKTLKLIIT
tara:strand:- start:34 stop:261 length:228 start_codon:yes stop_codon:yes gene_type:complete